MLDKIYHMAFARVFGIASLRTAEAYAHYQDPKVLFELSSEALGADNFLKSDERQRIKSLDFEQIKALAQITLDMGYHIITPNDDCFPKKLLEITPMPIVLYASGIAELLKYDQMVAMVGTRKPTAYGINAAKLLSEQLSSLGLIVVSGLAVGIDSASHTGALQGGSPTIAVVAAGLDDEYPKNNAQLRQLIERNGVILSEYPIGEFAQKHHFIARNRIISGLSRATIVVQAAAKSGSLITSGYALEQGRDVFAVPGSIFDTVSEGCHLLLNDGAYIAYNGESIYNTITRYTGGIVKLCVGDGIKQSKQQPVHSQPKPTHSAVSKNSVKSGQPPAKNASDFENATHQLIYNTLLEKSRNINDLCAITNLPIQRLMVEITFLEAMGLVESGAGRMYSALPYSN